MQFLFYIPSSYWFYNPTSLFLFGWERFSGFSFYSAPSMGKRNTFIVLLRRKFRVLRGAIYQFEYPTFTLLRNGFRFFHNAIYHFKCPTEAPKGLWCLSCYQRHQKGLIITRPVSNFLRHLNGLWLTHESYFRMFTRCHRYTLPLTWCGPVRA